MVWEAHGNRESNTLVYTTDNVIAALGLEYIRSPLRSKRAYMNTTVFRHARYKTEPWGQTFRDTM